jgi:hypothetical protein
MKTLLVAYCAAAAVTLIACGSDDTTEPPDVEDDPDPLQSLQSTAAPGSLDDLHERIISQRCSGQPGLCHNGQFEPNLSTPALTYAYLVNRPGIEKQDRLRVKPGDAGSSLFIDKIRNRNGVLTQMPLGAEPLAEADIAEIEKWIDDGALRAPDAEPAPTLNNPPRRPEIAMFNSAGTLRLDTIGPVRPTRGTTLVIRHSVQDFETPDESTFPFKALILSLDDGSGDVVLRPGATEDQHLGFTTFESGGPQGKGDQLNYRFDWAIPANNLQVRNAQGVISTRPSLDGVKVQPIVLYVDGANPGIVAFDIGTTLIEVQ